MIKFVFIKIPIFLLGVTFVISMVFPIWKGHPALRDEYELVGSFFYSGSVKHNAFEYMKKTTKELNGLGVEFSKCDGNEHKKICHTGKSVVSEIHFLNERSYKIVYLLKWPKEPIPGEILNVLRFDAEEPDAIDQGKMLWYNINGIKIIELVNVGTDPDWDVLDILKITASIKY